MSIPGSASPLFLTSAAAEAADYQIERSLRFNSADSAYLNRTPASAGNRKTWTWSGWVKRSALNSDQDIIIAESGSDVTELYFTSDTIWFYQYNGSYQGQLKTTQVFRDPSSWYHLVAVYDADNATASDRMRLYINGSRITEFSTSQDLSSGTQSALNNTYNHYIGARFASNSRYFNGYLAEIHFIDGQALAASDFGEYDNNNLWQPKEYSGTYGTNGFYLDFSDNSSASALGTDSSGNSNTWTVNNILAVSALSTPVSAAWTGYAGPNWLTTDTWDSLSDATTNFGNNGGTKGYSTITETWAGTKTSWTGAFGASNRGAIGWALKFPASVTITVNPAATSSIIACASTSTAVSAGTSYTSFPATMTGQVFWFTGSGYPSVGIYNSVTIPANSYTDSLIDTPTNYEAESGNNGGNYCTLNPLSGVGGSTLANGNLDFSGGSGDPIWRVGTIGMSSGKWYWEYTVGSVVINNYVGIFNNQNILSGYVLHGQSDFTTAGGTNSFSNNTFTTGDVFGVAVDIAAGSMQVFKNGSSIGSSTGNTLSTGTWFPVISVNVAPTTAWSLNFGQRPFAYTPPTGHLSLCTTNLPDPTIADGSTAFDVKLRNGSPSSTISGYGFSPDLLWEKARSKSGSHYLMDSVRGSTNTLSSDSTSAESSQPNYITGFTSDGFTTGTNDFTSGVSLVDWAWDAGSSTVTNTDGSITSNIRARPDTGFSIISYTGNGTAGATIGHGLNAVPGLLIVKNRSTSVTSPAWGVKHSGLYSNSGYWLKLENSDAAVVEGPGSGSLFNATNPGSSVFTVGPRNTTNTNGDNYIAYCWAPVEGFSSFGSYQGNGSSDGPFVYTGHRVKWLLLKRTDSTGDWFVLDSERNLFNPTDSYLRPNLANSELDNTEFVDLLSNGFKIKATGNAYNGSGATVIYAAYAEHPFASNARAR